MCIYIYVYIYIILHHIPVDLNIMESYLAGSLRITHRSATAHCDRYVTAMKSVSFP